jgi:cell division protein FtsW
MRDKYKGYLKPNNSSDRIVSEKTEIDASQDTKKGLFKRREEKSYSELALMLADKISENKSRVNVIHNVDPVFFILFVITAGCAFLVSLSATNSYAETFYGDKYHFVWQNLFFYLVGAILIFFAILLAKEIRNYAFFTLIGAVVAAVLLVLVLVIGKEAGGAKRWIQLGSVTIQPSEIAKTALVMVLALYMSIFRDKITDKKSIKNSFIYGVLYPMIPIAVICGLVYLEKHNSGMIIIAIIGLAVMFLGGTDFRWIIALVVVGVAAGAALIYFSGHGLDRIMSYLAPKDVITDDNWQTVQGLYAISSGGLFGLGFGESRLKYGYVSQPQNDFIFPIICEEFGLVGGLAVLILFLLIFFRAMKLGLNANNLFASITICGLATKLMLQVLLNICVVTAIGPNTGISLPLFSAGGSAMLFQFLEFGIILGLSRYCDVRS